MFTFVGRSRHTTWTLTKPLEKKQDGNYTRMLRAILNESLRQHPTRNLLYGHLPPITKAIQGIRTRHAGHCSRSRDELISDVLLLTPTNGRAKAGRPDRTYIRQLRIRNVSLKTCQRRWTIGRSGEKGSGISVLAARHDIYIYIYIYIPKNSLSQRSLLVAVWSEALVYRKLERVSIPASSVLRV